MAALPEDWSIQCNSAGLAGLWRGFGESAVVARGLPSTHPTSVTPNWQPGSLWKAAQRRPVGL